MRITTETKHLAVGNVAVISPVFILCRCILHWNSTALFEKVLT